MSHYFNQSPNTQHNRKEIHFRFLGIYLRLMSDTSVFSKDQVDFGSRLLIKNLVQANLKGSFLDLGCGYGVIACSLKQANPTLQVVASDVNQRAVALAKENGLLNHCDITVIESDGFDQISSTFDTIALNPPIRAGKHVMYDLFEKSIDYLRPKGSFWIVMKKQHGALSAKAKLESIYDSVTLVDREAGYHIYSCKKS